MGNPANEYIIPRMTMDDAITDSGTPSGRPPQTEAERNNQAREDKYRVLEAQAAEMLRADAMAAEKTHGDAERGEKASKAKYRVSDAQAAEMRKAATQGRGDFAANNLGAALGRALGHIRPEHLVPALHALGLSHLVSKIPPPSPSVASNNAFFAGRPAAQQAPVPPPGAQNVRMAPGPAPAAYAPGADPRAWLQWMAMHGGLGRGTGQ